MELSSYQQTNASFKLLCVYHLGVRSGFFSEYNNMVWSMLYCLRCGISFALATRDANFAFSKGWQDYFEPFCPERQSWLHHRWLHPRFPRPGLKFALQSGFLGDLIRQLEKADALTHDIWNGMRSQKTEDIEIPELNLRGSLRELSRELVDLTWRFNSETQAFINEHRAALKLPARYAGLHIRGGDKSKEAALRDGSAYIAKLRAVSDLRDVFVMSDDFRNIEILRKQFPELTFHTSTPEDAGGYRHRTYARRGKSAIREHHLELFSSIETMRRAEAAVCTFTSNIGIFLGMAMPFDRCHSLDGEWKMW